MNGRLNAQEDAPDTDQIVEFQGRVDGQGRRQGHGRLLFYSSSCSEAVVHESTVKGVFVDDELHGPATETRHDQDWTVTTTEMRYVHGELHGPSREYDGQGRLRAERHYDHGQPTGTTRLYFADGGTLEGPVDPQNGGAIDGHGTDAVTYTYPDGVSTLKGTWRQGAMVSAVFSSPCSRPSAPAATCYRHDEATASCIAPLDPLLPEPYESERVYVAPSRIPHAAEGLFAARAIAAGEVVCFYNGIRLTHEQVDGRDWALNDNTITLDDETVIDVPPLASSTSAYCASLGHKANHAFGGQHNAEYTPIEHHPRFGRIKGIRARRAIAKDEEITVTYGYEEGHEAQIEAPEWYHRGLREAKRMKTDH